MPTRLGEAAPGIHRIEDAHTNWYLVEEDGALTVVDCGVPTSWGSFEHALGGLVPRERRAADAASDAVRARARLGALPPAAGHAARRGRVRPVARPRIVAGAATVDSERALASLEAIAGTGAKTILCGHGPVWRDGAEAIADAARRRGPCER